MMPPHLLEELKITEFQHEENLAGGINAELSRSTFLIHLSI